MKHVALVTGAARNIGKGIAQVLGEAGCTCILVDADEQGLKRTANELKDRGTSCHEYVLDIGQIDALDELVLWLKENDLTPTVLVNNVAYESRSSIADITKTELAKSFRTNLESPFLLTSLIAQEWVKLDVKGNIVFTSSVHGKLIRTHSLYSSSKAAIEMFVKEAALEFAKHGIRVNAVAPGPTQDTKEPNPDYRVPLGFHQQPRDIGEVVKFLVSPQARFITGQTITVDGGYGLTHVHHWIKQGKLILPS